VCVLLNPYLWEQASLYRLNPELANFLVMPVLLAVQPVLLPVALTAALACAVCFQMESEHHTELWGEKRPRLALVCALAAILIALAGWTVLAAPFIAIALGTLAATPTYTRVATWARQTLTIALWAIAIEFLFSMSLDPLATVAKINP
jgi:hypothetical protein